MGILTTGFMAKYAIIQCCRLQSRQRSLLLQVNHAKKAVSNMEKQLKNQKNWQLQMLKTSTLGYQQTLATHYGLYDQSGNMNLDPNNGMTMNGSIWQYQQQVANVQNWQTQQAQMLENQYEAQLEALLEPLKQTEEDLETEKLDVDNDLEYWKGIKQSYAQQSKEEAKSFVQG